LYLRMESTPQDLAADIGAVEGLIMDNNTFFMKLSLLADSDRPAVEAFVQTREARSVSEKDFDGFLIYQGSQIALQPLPRRYHVAEGMKNAGYTDFGSYFSDKEAHLLVHEALTTMQQLQVVARQ